MSEVIPLTVRDFTKSCIIIVKGVYPVYEVENDITDGVAIEYTCDMHEHKTIVVALEADVALLIVRLTLAGFKAYGMHFQEAMELAEGVGVAMDLPPLEDAPGDD